MTTLYWAVFRRWKAVQDAAGPEIQLRETPETISLNQYGVRLTVYEAYAHRGPFLKDLCFYEYLCLVNFHRIGKKANIHKARYLPFDDSLEGSEGRWVQELREKGDHAVPVITGYLVDDVNNMNSGLYCWPAITLLALFVPWEQFMAIDKLQGYLHSDLDELSSVNAVWLEHLQHLPDRIKARVSTSTDGSSTRPRTAGTAWVGASYCTNWYRAAGTSTVPVRYRYNFFFLHLDSRSISGLSYTTLFALNS